MYIFVPSYPSLFYALYIAKKNNTTCILTNNDSVRKFMITLNQKCIYYEFKFKFERLLNLKSKLNKIINRLDNTQDFYLLDNAFAIDGFYFAAKWAKKGNVFFKNLSVETEIYDKKVGIKYLLKKILLEMVFGFKVAYRHCGNSLFVGIDKSFLLKHSIKEFPESFNYEIIKKDVISSFQVKHKSADFLWISQGQMENIINYRSLDNILGELLPNYNFAIKEHPKHKADAYSYSSILYPDYIPCEFLLSNINKCVLSVYSMTLKTAAQFENLKVVSLLELVDWCSNTYKDQVKHSLQKESGNRILFPKSILELKKILN